MIGQNMRNIIAAASFSQSAVARHFGISSQRFNQYLTGKREPDLAFIVKFCDFFNITPNMLLGYENTPNTPNDNIIIPADTLRDIVYTAYKVFAEHTALQKPKEDLETTAQKIADVCVNAAQVDTTDRKGQLKGMVLPLYVKKTG